VASHEDVILRLLGLLPQILTRVGVHRTPAGAELGLTNLQMGVLGALLHRDGCTMSELAENQMVVRSGATRIVTDLVRAGLVERQADAGDRRVVRLRITPRGREVVATIHREAPQVLDSILARMSEADQEALLRGLESFVCAVQSLDEQG
jgi:DNA-binding MarR family transcriptional regulator